GETMEWSRNGPFMRPDRGKTRCSLPQPACVLRSSVRQAACASRGPVPQSACGSLSMNVYA
ncbi:hypothetical protein HAX54_033941, partial [Datura stramonium]|nr:hypothetical protein [Datura stramonium]